MKKFAIKAVAVATGALAAGCALAGTITVTGGTTKFAVESLTASTVVTTPNFVYTMGVGRPIGNGFTIINTPSSGSTFGTCVIPTYVGPSTVSVTLKRFSGAECAYDVQVFTAAVAAGNTFTFTGQTYATHSLATAGSSISVSINLKDPGETSQVDNPGPITAAIATSGYALTLTAAQDTGTVTDVNHPSGPLFGFLSQNDDSASTATASFDIGNNTTNLFMLPNGTTPWNFVANGTAINVTVSGNFGGMATGGLTVSPTTGPAVAVAGTGGTRTFTLLPANINAAPSTNTVSVSFLSSLSVSLGTSRTFGVAAVGDVITGADDSLTGNANWWVWSANASQLMVPRMTTNTNYLSRFNLLNTGTIPVGYSATCYSEAGNAITYGTAKTGTLTANGLTVVNAGDICTFAGAARGSVIFTISAPINTVKGSYEAVDGKNFAFMITPLVRPYNQNNTTE